MDWSFFLQFVWLTSLEIESEDARRFLRVRIWIWRMQDDSCGYEFGFEGCETILAGTNLDLEDARRFLLKICSEKR